MTIEEKIVFTGDDQAKRQLNSLAEEAANVFANIDKSAQKAKFSGFQQTLSKLGQTLQGTGSKVSAFNEAMNSIPPGARRAAGVLEGLIQDLSACKSAAQVAGVAMAGLVIGIAGAAAAGIKLAESTARMIDGIQEAATRAGQSPQSFQRVAHAFEISAGKAQNLQRVVSQLDQAFADVSAGRSTKVTKAFDEMGVSLVGPNRQMKSLEQILIEVAGKFEYIRNPTDKAAKAVELFGRRAGPELVELLSLGKKGIKELFGELDKLGGVFSNADFKAADELTNAYTRLDAALRGVVGKYGILFAPIVTEQINNLTKFIVEHKDAIIGFGKIIIQTFDYIGQAVSFVGSIFVKAFEGWGLAAQKVAELLNQYFGTDFFTKFNVLAGVIAAIVIAFGGWIPVIIAVVVAVGALVKQLYNLGWDGVKQKAIAAWEAIKNYIYQVAKAIWDYIVATWNASTLGQIANQIVEYFKTAWEYIKTAGTDAWNFITEKVKTFIDFVKSAYEAVKQLFGAGDSGSGGATGRYARGGHIRGRGTSTSDSIPAWLSRGEWVIRAAAVRKYGSGLFAALNSMRMSPGGLMDRLAPASAVVPMSAPRFADGGPVSGGRPVTLDFGDRSIGGLTATPGAVKQLERYAVKRALASAGRKPTWHR